MRLIAKSHILYDNVDYIPGDELPECDLSEMWVASGSAFYENEEQEEKELPKARLLTATPGRVGVTTDGEGCESLIGKVPISDVRKRPPANQRRSGRKKIYE